MEIAFTGDGPAPFRQYDNDAGFDLYVHLEGGDGASVCIRPGAGVDVPHGISVKFPRGWYGRITGRSSTIRVRSLLVIEGIIDEGYTGPLFSYVFNPGPHPAYVKHGERISQMLLMQTPPPVQFRRTQWLGLTERADRGFGSSGD